MNITVTIEQSISIVNALTKQIETLQQYRAESHSGVDQLLFDSAIINSKSALELFVPTQTIEGN